MHDAERSQYLRRVSAAFPVPFLLLALALLVGGASRQPQRPVPPELRAVEAQLTALTNDVAQTISERFSFYFSDTKLKLSKRKDWYKILGISKTTPPTYIKHAYKRLDRGEDLDEVGMGGGGGGFDPFGGDGGKQYTFHHGGGFPRGGFPGGFQFNFG
ncbi:DnaJ protein P58IPK [Hordeum vulgare]|nr:DnaJ protein P58IPK [Hordeum vulgare]